MSADDKDKLVCGDAPVSIPDAVIQTGGGCLEAAVGRIPLILFAAYLAIEAMFRVIF